MSAVRGIKRIAGNYRRLMGKTVIATNKSFDCSDDLISPPFFIAEI